VSNFLANLVKFLRRKFTIFSYFKIISTFNFQIRFFPQFVRNAGNALAEISSYSFIQGTLPGSVPEPSSILGLLSLGVLGIGAALNRKL
jgi:hypothetical protein